MEPCKMQAALQLMSKRSGRANIKDCKKEQAKKHLVQNWKQKRQKMISRNSPVIWGYWCDCFQDSFFVVPPWFAYKAPLTGSISCPGKKPHKKDKDFFLSRTEWPSALYDILESLPSYESNWQQHVAVPPRSQLCVPSQGQQHTTQLLRRASILRKPKNERKTSRWVDLHSGFTINTAPN